MSQLIEKDIIGKNELTIQRFFSSIIFQYYYKFLYDLFDKYKNLDLQLNTNDSDIKTYLKSNFPDTLFKLDIKAFHINFELNNNELIITFKIDDYTIIKYEINKSTNIKIYTQTIEDKYKNIIDNKDNIIKLHNFIQWLSFNYLWNSKLSFFQLFYHETVIKGSTTKTGIEECIKTPGALENKYLKKNNIF